MFKGLDITLVVPTHNRQNYLTRLFEYYKNSGLKIICVDSTMNKYEGEISEDITYIHLPNHKFIEKMNIALGQVNTSLTVCCADDDFIIKNSILKGYQVCKNDKDIIALTGQYIGFLKRFNGNYYGIYSSNNFYTLENNKLKNVQNFMGNYYMILWGMYKTEKIKLCYKIIKQAKFSNDNFIEFIIGTLLSYSGEIKFLNDIWGVREIEFQDSWGKRHESLCLIEKESVEVNNIKKLIDYNTEKRCFNVAFDAYNIFCNQVVNNSIKARIVSFMPRKIKYLLYPLMKKALYTTSELNEVSSCILRNKI